MGKFTGVLLASDFDNTLVYTQEALLSGGSMTEFELSLDNTINDYLSDAVRLGFGPAAVISYLAAVENEVMTLRIILTGRLMGISQEALRGRLRDSYV